MQAIKPQTFRPKRVIFAIAVSLLLLGLVTGPLQHQLLVWLHGGVWCAQFEPDGAERVKYGSKNCGI